MIRAVKSVALILFAVILLVSGAAPEARVQASAPASAPVQAGAPAEAQTAPPPGPPTEAQIAARTLLAGANTIRCVFTVSVRTTWRNGVPQPAIRPPGNFIVNIRDIKSDAGSAVLAAPSGNGGKDITLVVAEHNRYFLDAGGGRVVMTAVLGEFSIGTRLKASHSISDFTALDLPGFSAQPDIVQYWGDCEVLP